MSVTHLWNGFYRGHSTVKCSGNKVGMKLTFHPNDTTCKKCLKVLERERNERRKL